jgi:signal transduction histidine kinase/CheY-like chemotaxis protein
MTDIENRIFELAKKSDSEFFTITYLNPDNSNYVSDSVYNITGFTPKELTEDLGGLNSIIYEEDRFKVKKELTNFITGNKNTTQISFRIVTKDNNIKNITQTIFAVKDEQNQIIALEAINKDITNLTQKATISEEEYQKLTEKNSAKDKFISIISHDLRAPFTSIIGFSEILLNEKDLPELERQEYLSYIRDAAETQLELVNHLLDWSRLQSGRITLDLKRLNLKIIVSNAISQLTGIAIRKGITVNNLVPDNFSINADEKLILQVLTNLIGNSIKFTPTGKQIYVSADNYKTGFIEIIVKDEGTGIAEKDINKVFKIGEKFTINGTNGEKGSGLGLILVKEIIEKHGGNIWFYSKEGEGTDFHFTIPEAKNIVLIVEDDPDMLNLYHKILNKYLPNFDIIEAANGYDAIRIIVNKIPSLVITDHEMPLMSGIQLVETLRKKDENKNIPVIVVSAKFNESIKQTYLNMGVNKLIPKPIEGKILADIIHNCVY